VTRDRGARLVDPGWSKRLGSPDASCTTETRRRQPAGASPRVQLDSTRLGGGRVHMPARSAAAGRARAAPRRRRAHRTACVPPALPPARRAPPQPPPRAPAGPKARATVWPARRPRAHQAAMRMRPRCSAARPLRGWLRRRCTRSMTQAAGPASVQGPMHSCKPNLQHPLRRSNDAACPQHGQRNIRPPKD